MKKHIANIITACRIFGSLLLLLFPLFSAEFYILYIFLGLSDMIDGTIARKTGSVSPFGERFDTFSDFIFLAVSLIKFLPVIHIPLWLWIWIFVIGIIKIGNIILGFIKKKQIISPHTMMNKVTGLFLFLLPLTLPFIEPKYSLIPVSLIATFSAIQEGYYIYK